MAHDSKRWIGAWLAGAVVCIGMPATALAEGGGRDAGGSLSVLLLLVVVGVAYLITHFVLGAVQRRFLVVPGLEYVVVGVLLGPAVPQIHAFDDMTTLLPIIALAAGWVGLLRGTELSFAKFRDAPAGVFRLVFGDDFLSAVVVGGTAFLILRSGLVPDVGFSEAALCSAVLACTAATGSTEPLDVVKGRYHVEGKTVPLLRSSARIGDAIALIGFGLLFCIFHRDAPDAVPTPATTLAVIEIGLLGIGLGVLFYFFLAGDESDNASFLTLIGIVTFASGAAWFLNLSGLLASLTLGFVLANFARKGDRIRSTLERTGRPMGIVLLVFAGALWRVPAPLGRAWDRLVTVPSFGAAEWVAAEVAMWVLVPLLLFAGFRWLGKLLGAAFAAWGQPFRSDLHRGLLGHGDVTVAMAISFRLVYGDWGAIVDVTYTVIVASVIFHDLIAPRMVRSLLVDTGELRGEASV